MQIHKFDINQPHGVIWGHPEASYEQNGILYDGAGEPLDQSVIEHMYENIDRSAEIAFLKEILAGGAMLQANIKKESELKNLIWSDVTAAAAEMGMIKYKTGTSLNWKLAEDK